MKASKALLNLVTVFLSLSLILGCKPEPKVLTEEEKQFINEHEKIAYGEFVFGMSEEEGDKFKSKVKIKDTEFMTVPMYDAKDQLYRLLMVSDEVTLDKVQNSLKLSYWDTQDVISTKYGKPVINMNYPSTFYFGPTNLYRLSKWNVGDKVIELSVHLNRRNKYDLFLDIHSASMQIQVDKQRKIDRAKESEEEASKF